jgi:hypothetical protein
VAESAVAVVEAQEWTHKAKWVLLHEVQWLLL